MALTNPVPLCSESFVNARNPDIALNARAAISELQAFDVMLNP
jgi:hypothetical protein